MVAIGVLGLVALFALDRAIDAMPPALLAPVLYTELAWDVLLHWHQHVGGRTSLGIVLILIAVAPALAWRSKRATAVAGVTA
jgi:drug/metabolite transporter (DMT)-like permease